MRQFEITDGTDFEAVTTQVLVPQGGAVGGAVTLPDATAMFQGAYAQDGQDLLITHGGETLRVPGYFQTLPPVDLVSPNGAVIRGDVAAKLAGVQPDTRTALLHNTESDDGAGAVVEDLGAPIGQVEGIEGTVSVTRADGSRVLLGDGDPIFKEDLVETGQSGSVSLTFVDGTIFSLSPSSRMIIDELVYDPNGSNNEASFNLVQGGFVFIAGKVAKTGEMEVETPSSTMGIRGTTVRVQILNNDGLVEVTVSLLTDPDGGIGRIELRSLDGELLADITETDSAWIVDPSGENAIEVAKTASDFASEQELVAAAVNAYQQAITRIEAGDPPVAPEGGTQESGGEAPPPPPINEGEGLEGIDGSGQNPPPPPTGLAPVVPVGLPPDQVTGSNLPPTTEDGTLSLAEDGSATGTLAATDPEGNALTFAILQGPANGTLVLLDPATGTYSYTPTGDFNGADSFTFTVTDALGNVSAPATVSITVGAVNDAPEASDFTFPATEDVILGGNVLTQGSALNRLAASGSPAKAATQQQGTIDVDGDTLTVVAGTFETEQGGTVILAADGSFTYTPAQDFNGQDSFTYTVSDGLLTDTAKVTLTVNAVDDAPVANDDSFAGAEDQTIEGNLLDNDLDVDGDALKVPTGTFATAEGGSIAIAADGSFVYTPPPNFHGTDSFDYTLTAGDKSDTATVTLTVAPVNDAPVAVDDNFFGTEDQPISGNVLGAPETIFADRFLDGPVQVASIFQPQDFDVDGDALSVISGTIPTAQGGRVEIAADGSFIYTPPPNFNGTDSFDYTVTDGSLTDIGTVTLSVAAVNDAPSAQDDVFSGVEDQPITGNVLGPEQLGEVNELGQAQGIARRQTPDFDADGDALSVIAGTITTAQGGSVEIASDGSFTYTPLPNFNGTDSFDYTVTDGSLTDVGTVTLNVSAVNDAPVAVDDVFYGTEDQSIGGNVLDANGPSSLGAQGVVYTVAKDSDVDGDALSVIAGTITTAQGGSVQIASDGSFTYTPPPNFNGRDSFDYTVTDGSLTDVGTVTLNVSAVNDAPVAVDDVFYGTEDQSIGGNVLDANGPSSLGAQGVVYTVAKDSDVDGDALSVIAGTITTAQGGSVQIASDGSFTYTPPPNFNGRDSFDYTVTDGSLTDVGTVTLNVSAVNDAPVAVDDVFYGSEDQSIGGNVLDANGPSSLGAQGVIYTGAKDSDVDGDALSVIAGTITTAQGGSVEIAADGSFTYTPPPNFNGADNFDYTVTDGALIDTGTVTLYVAPVNDAPVPDGESVTTAIGAAIQIDVLEGDTDVDGDALSVSAVTQGGNGAVVINLDGTVTYTPNDGFAGDDTFTYTVSDGKGGEVEQAVTVSVQRVLPFKETSDDPNTGDQVGWSVATSANGMFFVAGAPGDDAAGTDAGAAYLFDAQGNQLAKLSPTGAASGDRTGFSVDVSADGGTIAVGAASANGSGVVYVYDKSGDLVSTLSDPQGGANDLFGGAVRVSADGQKILVGAPLKDNSAQDASDSGAVFVFSRDGSLQATIEAPTSESFDRFGAALDMAADGGLIAVGAPGSLSFLGILFGGKGAVHLFDGSGRLITSVEAPAGHVGDLFGLSVAVSADGSRVIVGAPAQGGDGKAYVYDAAGNLLTTLTSPEPGFVDGFGSSVAVSGDGTLFAVSEPLDDGSASNGGMVLIFDSAGNVVSRITAPSAAASDQFGLSLDLSEDGNTLIVGAPVSDQLNLVTTTSFASQAIVAAGAIHMLQRIGDENFVDHLGNVYGEQGVVATVSLLPVAGQVTQTGTDAGELLEGSDTAPDQIDARGGDDTVLGGGLNDTLLGGDGADLIYGGLGAQGADNDVILGGSGDDTAFGGIGNDAIAGGSGADTAIGGEGNDTVSGDAGGDLLVGNAGSDLLSGGSGNDTLFGDHATTNIVPTVVSPNGLVVGGDFTGSDGDNPAGWVVTETSASQVEVRADTLRFNSSNSNVGGSVSQLVNGFLVGAVYELSFDYSELLGRDNGDARVTARLTDANGVVIYESEVTDPGQVTHQFIATGGSYTLEFIDTSIPSVAQIDPFIDNVGISLVVPPSSAPSEDTLLGGDGLDMLNGGAGADLLDGGAEADVMLGGAGDDSLRTDHSGTAGTSDTIDGGAGQDVVEFTSSGSFDFSQLGVGTNIKDVEVLDFENGGTDTIQLNIQDVIDMSSDAELLLTNAGFTSALDGVRILADVGDRVELGGDGSGLVEKAVTTFSDQGVTYDVYQFIDDSGILGYVAVDQDATVINLTVSQP